MVFQARDESLYTQWMDALREAQHWGGGGGSHRSTPNDYRQVSWPCPIYTTRQPRSITEKLSAIIVHFLIFKALIVSGEGLRLRGGLWVRLGGGGGRGSGYISGR